MAAQSKLNDLRMAAARESYRDGLTEIVAGVFLFIVALATGRPAFYWTYLVALLMLGPGLHLLKGRFTYPRIGYVKLEGEDPGRLRNGILTWFGVVFFLAAVILASSGQLGDELAWRRIAPALCGFLFAGGFLSLSLKSGFIRHWILLAVSVLSGLLMTIPVIPEPYGNVRVWALIMALICLLTGGAVLCRFVRTVPIVEERLPNED